MCKPDITSDDTVVTDLCIAAEDCCARINNNIVADVGMTLDTFYEGSVGINRKTLRTERNALIKFNTLADCGGLTDNNTGTVVDEKVRSDFSAGMHVDACRSVSVLGHHSRQDGYVLLI